MAQLHVAAPHTPRTERGEPILELPCCARGTLQRRSAAVVTPSEAGPAAPDGGGTVALTRTRATPPRPSCRHYAVYLRARSGCSESMLNHLHVEA